MPNFLFFDFETDSKDPKTAKVLEVACATFSDRGRLLSSGSEVFSQDAPNEEVFDLINLNLEEIKNGTHPSLLESFLIKHFLGDVDYVVGHNILKYDCEILKKLNLDHILKGKILIDTMVDLPFPPRTTSKRLTHLCSDHGIPTPEAHGALYDCIYTAELFFKYDLADTCARASSEAVFVRANVTPQTKDLAKPFGFRWDPAQKTWWKQIRLYDREKFLTSIDNAFEVHRLPPDFAPTENA